MRKGTPEQRGDEERIDRVLAIERDFAENARDLVTIAQLARRIERRSRLQAAVVSQVAHAPLLTLAARAEELLPLVNGLKVH